METKIYFLRDEFDNTYKIFATTEHGQNLLFARVEFAPDGDFKWEMRFMEWICSRSLPREVSHG